LVVWPMIEFEADDALATAAARYAESADVEQVLICTPDKDMAQCVRGSRIVCLDRMRRRTIDEAAVIEKFGVSPASIPDWLALVGDDADGIPGVPRWGAKSASTILARYGRLEAIPDDEAQWDVVLRGAANLAKSLRECRVEAVLYRRLATLRMDVPLVENIEDLRWCGAIRSELTELCKEIGDERFVERVHRWRD
jgi:5'-3' exonuclease